MADRQLGFFTFKTIILGILFMTISAGCTGNSADFATGVKNGKLADCPSSPNCVSTQTTDNDKRMPPLAFKGDLATARQKILTILTGQKRTTIITQKDNYLHAEVRSALFKFVDDVEFYFDKASQLIHFRSASRSGYSDLGVNRKRMATLSSLYLNDDG